MPIFNFLCLSFLFFLSFFLLRFPCASFLGSNAREIHSFTRDVDESKGRIQEKMMMIAGDETPRDLSAVESLKRKHEGFERDLAALEESVSLLTDEAKRLLALYPASATQVCLFLFFFS